MEKKKVFVLARLKEQEIQDLKVKFQNEYEFLLATNDEDKEKYLSEAEVVIGEPDISEIKDRKALKWVQMTWAGTDKYTCASDFPRNVMLTNASGSFGDIMSEYAIGQILGAMRHFSYYKEQQKQGVWMTSPYKDITLFGKKVMILGAGDIGSKTAIRLKAFSCETIGVCRNVNGKRPGFDKLITLNEVDQHLGDVDIVIGCIPNNADSRGFLHKERLEKMKKDSILLNMGRGNLIVTDDLLEVLQKGWFEAVILDVTNPEPLPGDHPLWKQERVIITPHVSGPSLNKNEHTQKLIVDIITNNLERYAKNGVLCNLIQGWDNERR